MQKRAARVQKFHLIREKKDPIPERSGRPEPRQRDRRKGCPPRAQVGRKAYSWEEKENGNTKKGKKAGEPNDGRPTSWVK